MRSALTLLLFAAGCVTVTPAGEKVRVTRHAEAIRGCEFMGSVRDQGSNLAGDPILRVEKMLQNRAAALGGNVVVVTITQDAVTTGVGEVYKCKEAAQ